MDNDIRIEWAADIDKSAAYTKFFVDNVDISYISHSEIQIGRALSTDEWSPDLFDSVNNELRDALVTAGAKRVFIAHNNDLVVGLGVVVIHPEESGSHAVLEDFVVARSHRGHGYGKQILEWLIEQLKRRDVRSVFLESGITNVAAHSFFEANHFEVCSVVMKRDIA